MRHSSIIRSIALGFWRVPYHNSSYRSSWAVTRRPIVAAICAQEVSSPMLLDLYMSREQQHDDDDENNPDAAAWVVAPVPAVRPSRKRTHQEEN